MSNIETAIKNIIKHRKDYFIATIIISMAMAALIFLQLLVRELKYGIQCAIDRSGFNIITLNVEDFSDQIESSQFNYLVFHALKDSLADKFENKVAITPIQMKKVTLGTKPDELFFNTTAVGVEQDFFSLRSFELTAGELFRSQQFEQGDAVILITGEIKEKIFGKNERSVLNLPIYLGIENQIKQLRVVGIIKQEQDRRYAKIFTNPVFTGVYVPLFYFKQESFSPLSFLTPKIYTVSISDVVVKPKKNAVDYNTMHDRLISYFNQLGIEFSESMYNFTNIKVQRLIDASEKLSKIFSIITILTEIIVLTIIMVIVVRSRHPEITIRKIEGATNRNVATMFCWEGIGVALIGGLMGIVIGFLLKKIVFQIGNLELSQHALLIFLGGFVLSILVGIAATVIPAIIAWQAKPAEGLKTIKL
jgi:ABC-type antimicrobial peptide transport system permease subunit